MLCFLPMMLATTMFMIGDFYIRLFLVNDRQHFEANAAADVVASTLPNSMAFDASRRPVLRLIGWSRCTIAHGTTANDEV